MDAESLTTSNGTVRDAEMNATARQSVPVQYSTLVLQRVSVSASGEMQSNKSNNIAADKIS